MVLPMIGTWVGTVLAFYFGKQQLEAATRSVTAIARELTPEEKLGSIKAIDKMIPRGLMFASTEEPAKLKLLDEITRLEGTRKGSRLPVLTKDDRPLNVIHRSTIEQFIVKAMGSGKSSDQVKDLTLQDLLQDVDLGPAVQKSVAVVPETATLADAKRAMAAMSSWCQDVIVTRTGTAAEPVIGWITNVILEANSKL
jgi:hypothetical protein